MVALLDRPGLELGRFRARRLLGHSERKGAQSPRVAVRNTQGSGYLEPLSITLPSEDQVDRDRSCAWQSIVETQSQAAAVE